MIEPMSDRRTLGQEIRRLRLALGMTLAELSSRSQVREAYLAAVEDDREEPSARALRRIARHLEPAGTSFEQLAGLLTAPEFDGTGDYPPNRTARIPPAAPLPDDRPVERINGEERDDPPVADVQFERAEFDEADGPAPCGLCREPMLNAYFEVNGAVVCARCCELLRARLNAGSPASRAARATGAGVAAAGAGTILYYGVLAATGISFGLLAIVVGFMVGKAVGWGSYGRGGWRYQTLAMVLTYLAMVTSYVPPIVKEFSQNPGSTARANSRAGEQGTDSPSDNSAGRRTATPASEPSTVKQQPLTLGRALIYLALLVLFACAVPFLRGVDGVLGLVIIGIGVYEAWKFNRRRSIVITGPHALRSSVATATGA